MDKACRAGLSTGCFCYPGTTADVCDVIRFNHPDTGNHSLNRFDPECPRGKQPLTLALNRDPLLRNQHHGAPTRTIVNRMLPALAAWRRG